MGEMALTTRMVLTRCMQHQHAALAQLSACLDKPVSQEDRTRVVECIGAVTRAQAVVRRMLGLPSGLGHPDRC